MLMDWYILHSIHIYGLYLVRVSPISGRRNKMLNHLKVLVSWFLCLSLRVTVHGHPESEIYGTVLHHVLDIMSRISSCLTTPPL